MCACIPGRFPHDRIVPSLLTRPRAPATSGPMPRSLFGCVRLKGYTYTGTRENTLAIRSAAKDTVCLSCMCLDPSRPILLSSALMLPSTTRQGNATSCTCAPRTARKPPSRHGPASRLSTSPSARDAAWSSNPPRDASLPRPGHLGPRLSASPSGVPLPVRDGSGLAGGVWQAQRHSPPEPPGWPRTRDWGERRLLLGASPEPCALGLRPS